MPSHRGDGRARHSSGTIGFAIGIAVLTVAVLIAFAIAA